MPWGRMDDKFHRNRKVRELRQKKGGREALGIWVFWWSWCLDDPDLTGFVPATELSAADEKGAGLLVETGLWDAVDGGYRFHDFNDYNPTRDQVDGKRKADRERVAVKRKASRGNVACDTAATSERVASTRVPSRPDLSPVAPEGGTPANDTVSSSHIQETWDAIRERYHQANTASPHPTRSQAAAVAGRVKEIAKLHSQPFRETALALAAAALAEPKQRGVWALLDLDPYASGPGPAKVRMVMGTKGVLVPEDHFDAPHKQPLAW